MKMIANAFLLVSGLILFAACSNNSSKQSTVSFKDYKVADGFELQLVAAEPLIEAPVTMQFDNEGRIWVVEMSGYMPNLAGSGEDAPVGRISILSDFDENGTAQSSKVFLDSLVLPRAIAHVYGGLLYAAPPNLWFVEINNDKPGRRTLVDSLYSDAGNVEAQANGLMMSMDNWIYNANSSSRYQLKDGKWVKEPTAFRGQWGITMDNFGRLYYNSNEIQIEGDYVLPNTVINNPYFRPKATINNLLTQNQFVYPLHPTTVNRGGEKGILNKDSLLVRVTAACGPLIYRGEQFPDEYKLNAFICEPQGNLVKRNILTFDGMQTTAKQAWDDREFIASTDEGFRPVNLLNAPDGAMYVVDMHKGIMQHRAYATPYYRNRIAREKLDTLQKQGRIIRVKYKDRPLGKLPDLIHATPNALADLLKSANGWIRDRAQQQLILRNDQAVVPALQQLAKDGSNEIAAIHALHVLDGLNALSFDFLQQVAAASSSPMLTAHALLLLEKFNTKENVAAMQQLVESLSAKKDSIVDWYIAASLKSWLPVAEKTFLPIMVKLSESYAGNAMFQEAVINSIKDKENEFRSALPKAAVSDTTHVINAMLAEVAKNKREKKINPIFDKSIHRHDPRTVGLVIYRSTCAACHGAGGEGIENVAPPLNGSEYVEGPSARLAMILLNRLEGPIHIKGKLYQFNGSMPNFGNNFSEQQIADVIQYLHNSFVARPPKSISAEEIKKLKASHSGTLTEADLLKMPVLTETKK
jgi:mono/diheme cytochrome c family protein